MEELGNRIKYLRTKNHWTQHELARQASLSRSHVSQLENNKISNPGVAAIRSLAKVFEVAEDTLFVFGPDDLPGLLSNQDGFKAGGKPLSVTPLIFDPELSQWLTPHILNQLKPDTIRAIIAIIRDAVGANLQTEEKEKKHRPPEPSVNNPIDFDNLTQFASTASENQPVNDFSSFRGSGGFVIAL